MGTHSYATTLNQLEEWKERTRDARREIAALRRCVEQLLQVLADADTDPEDTDRVRVIMERLERSVNYRYNPRKGRALEPEQVWTLTRWRNESRTGKPIQQLQVRCARPSMTRTWREWLQKQNADVPGYAYIGYAKAEVKDPRPVLSIRKRALDNGLHVFDLHNATTGVLVDGDFANRYAAIKWAEQHKFRVL